MTLRFKLLVATSPSVSFEMGVSSGWLGLLLTLRSDAWPAAGVLDLDTAAAVAEVGEGDTAVALAEVRLGDGLSLPTPARERPLTRLRSCELMTSSGMALRGGGRVDHSKDIETGVRSRSSMRYGCCWLSKGRGRAFGL